MSQLAILGGDPVRTPPFSPWPQSRPSDIPRLVQQVDRRLPKMPEQLVPVLQNLGVVSAGTRK